MKRRLRWLLPAVATAVALAGGTALGPGATSSAAAATRDAASPIPRKPWPSASHSPTASPPPPIVLLSVGDSLTYGTDGSAYASYRLELSRLLGMTGQPHTWAVEAVGGTKCSYWAAHIDAIITADHPNLIFLDCGTNDTPADNTEADYRTILATAQTRGVPIVASLIGRPDMESPTNTVRPWIADWMDGTNDAIRRALASYPNVPVAPMLRVPANPEWLQADGIHLTIRAETAYGQLFYEAAQPSRGWRTLTQLHTHEMCGLSGHDRDDPWPPPDTAYLVCRS